MNSHISSSKTSTFSAPVVQSRLEHHHQQQLKQPEARQYQHQRSKSLNKGKRYNHNYNNYHQKKETITFTSSSTSSTTTEVARNNNKNFSNFNNNFDSSYHRDNNLVENGQLQRKTSTSSRPPRRHQHSDSVDEDRFRVTPVISILKRPQSATDFVKTTSNSKSNFSLDVTKEEQGFNVNNNHRSNGKVGERSPPQQRRRSDATPPKTKRSQRNEVKSMEFETDLLFNINSSQPITTTQQLSGSGDESDVNSNNNNNKFGKPVSTNAVIFPPLNYSNAIIALEEGMMNSNKKEDIYSNSDDNATVKRVNKKRSDEPAPRRLSSTAIELQSQVSRFADSDSFLFSESILLSTSPPARRPSSSPSRLGGCSPKLYAGPTFHNSPAPSDLPMPSFYSKSLGKDPSPLSAGNNNLFTVPENAPSPPPNVHSNYDTYSSPSSGNTSDDDIFAMDDVEPSKVPYYPETPTLRKEKSQDLLRILSAANARQYPTAASYMVPERMATAHHPMQVHPVNLNEISETLRSLLKIHGQ